MSHSLFERTPALVLVMALAFGHQVSAQKPPALIHPDSVPPGTRYAERNCVAFSPWARAKNAPTFEDFRVSDTSAPARPALVRLNNHIARLYRSVIRAGASNSPDFAGHFTVVMWPNGTFPNLVIVDARNGQVYSDTLLTFSLPFPPMYRRDSRLMIIDATSMGTNDSGRPAYPWVDYLEWTGSRFKSRRLEAPIGCVERAP